MTRTLVIDGHPNPDSLTAALAREYAAGAGDDAVLLSLRDLQIDPDLHGGYTSDQPVEADLLRARELIEWSEHITVLAPVWWGSVPALLKGFLDRTLVIGWAFRYKDNGLPLGLLAGRTGRIIITADSPRWYLPLVGDTTVKQLKGRTLEFCGIKPVKVTRFSHVRSASDERRAGWLEQARRLGADDAGAPARVATSVAS
ncbi:NAD(P)H-dependent oxidoreductase [Nocardioides sp.]|uniref:NAD(P)H-dependent oxidoreductase n=1 Tax=Nocardioides sp. TaxID=35761 RepID=UPI002C569EE4|nr:NAD(P)H-dependent oxidoreductase [Nocardioides sp.]HXH80388.1 NAD(P)H-dependent oxidoreductase [Nocardioides sp.]